MKRHEMKIAMAKVLWVEVLQTRQNFGIMLPYNAEKENQSARRTQKILCAPRIRLPCTKPWHTACVAGHRLVALDTSFILQRHDK